MTTTIFMWAVVILLGLIFMWLYLIGGYLIGIKRTLYSINDNLIESNTKQGWFSYPPER